MTREKLGIIALLIVLALAIFGAYQTDNMVEYIGDHRDNSYGYDTYDIEVGQVWLYTYQTDDPFDNYFNQTIDSVISISNKYVQFENTKTKEIDSRSKRGFLYDRQLMYNSSGQLMPFKNEMK